MERETFTDSFCLLQQDGVLISLLNALHGCTPATQSIGTPIAIKHDDWYLDGANKAFPFNVGTCMEG